MVINLIKIRCVLGQSPPRRRLTFLSGYVLYSPQNVLLAWIPLGWSPLGPSVPHPAARSPEPRAACAAHCVVPPPSPRVCFLKSR